MKLRATLLSLALCAALVLPSTAKVLSAPSTTADNSAPIAENLSLSTFKGIAVTSRFAATDPDGDSVTFRIIESPARGRVTVDQADPACFWYTPYEGKKGKDSFTYVAIDPNGQQSEPATVSINIEKQSTKITYSDMIGERAAYAATRLAEAGVYVGCQIDGQYCFGPNAEVTREEFLALAMSVVGTDPLQGITVTGFFDDHSISAWAKGYVSAALLEGAVRGSYDAAGYVIFRGGDQITFAEAAVIADRLLSVANVSGADSPAVPAWAAQSVANLESVSVFSPDTDPSATLTRGDAALILSSMLDVVASRNESNWIW